MFKKLLVVAALAVSATVANAGILYWQVSSSDASRYDATAARVVGYSSNGAAQLLFRATYDSANDSFRVSSFSDLVFKSDGYEGLTYFDDSSAITSFVVELGSYTDGNWVGKVVSAGIANNNLSSYITEGMALPKTYTAVQAGGWMIPEPTSGLMLLIGAAMLGLRRKKA